MSKIPHKEVSNFFFELIGVGGVIFLIMGFIALKLLDAIGLIKTNF